MEPGRFIVGNAGILVTKVLYIKATPKKKFVIVDAGMNDLIRPALYDAYHQIMSLRNTEYGRRNTEEVDVVGPICESADFFAKDRRLARVKAGDYLAVMSAGAYGFSMSSNYNSRPRAAEVLIDKNKTILVRKRETYKDLLRNESL
jgi:diaminopimelate decarboxylase